MSCLTARYAKNAGAVCSLKAHLVWCPKYRRQVLVHVVAQRLETLLREKAAELALAMQALAIMPDHGHLFGACDPRGSRAEIVNRLQGYMSRTLRQEFASLRSRLAPLWSRSDDAGRIGQVSETTVRRDIEAPTGR